MTKDYPQHMLNIAYGYMDWIPKEFKKDEQK